MAHPQRPEPLGCSVCIGHYVLHSINTRKPYSVVLQLINSFEPNSRFLPYHAAKNRAHVDTPESRAEETLARKSVNHSSTTA